MNFVFEHNNIKQKIMKMHIKSETTVADLQNEFKKVYPFLKIEFYGKPHAEKKLSAKKDKIISVKRISELGKSFKEGSVDISKHRTVAQLEKDFYKKFGVALQVLRRSQNTWIETSFTDNRTLEMQNTGGESSAFPSTPISEEEFINTRMDVNSIES